MKYRKYPCGAFTLQEFSKVKSCTFHFDVQLPFLFCYLFSLATIQILTFLRSVHFPGTSHKQAVRLRAAQPYESSQVREAYPRW